jgi:hypothetical protein
VSGAKSFPSNNFPACFVGNRAAMKTYQKATLKNLSLFYCPRDASAGKDIVVARFYRDYQFNNFHDETTKQLHLEREQGQWKIIYEGKPQAISNSAGDTIICRSVHASGRAC